MLYTEPRYTKAIDVVVGVTDADVEAVGVAMGKFGFPMTEELIQDLKRPSRMISIGHPPSIIDILNEIAGIDFEDAWARRNVVPIDGVDVSFIGLEDLIDAKRASGRPQDLIDLSSLETERMRKA